MASVRTPEETDPANIPNKEFGEKLDQIVKYNNDLLTIASRVYALKGSEKLRFPNGEVVSKTDTRHARSLINKEIKALKKHYTAHGKKPKRRRNKQTQAGFKNPVVIKDNLRGFLSAANLGPSDPQNPASPPLSDVLMLRDNSVTTRAILTPLFNIYARINNMQQDPNNKQYLTSTPEMDQYFQDTYARLMARPQKKSEKTGKLQPKFDPKHFRFASLQSIVADQTEPNDSLGPEMVAFLNNPQVKERLESEQEMVSNALAYYRWVKDGKRGTLEEFKRKEKNRKEKKWRR